MSKKTKKFLQFKYAEELTKSAFIAVVTILLTAPILDSILLSIAIAEIFCAVAFMPDVDDAVKNSKKINLISNYILPAIMLLIVIVLNFANIKAILLASVISFITALLTIRSESVFHSIGMVALPIAQFTVIEGSRGNLENILNAFKKPENAEYLTSLFLVYVAAIGIIYAFYNISFLIFKNKKIVFSLFGIISVIFSFVNAISVIFLNRLFTFSIISELINILKSTTDWSSYINTTVLFNTSVVSAIIFAVLYFPFMNALMSESSGFMIFKERAIRFIFGCVLLFICVTVIKSLLLEIQTAGISFPDFLISSIILNTNSETTVPLIN